MEFFEALEYRRSVRKFTDKAVPDALIEKALQAAVKAPNSSNTQTWDFHWAKSPEAKAKVVKACLSQSAARTANQIVVITANPKKWRRSQKSLIKWAEDSKAHPSVVLYYKKIIPVMYTSGFFNIFAPIKWILSFLIGLVRPITRGPNTTGDSYEVAVKSAALAAENFVLAIAAQGADTCMMEGFDAWRMKCALKLKCSDRVVMAIGIGYRGEKGVWGPQFRLPSDEVIHIH